MAILVKGQTFTSTDTVTNTKLHNLVDAAAFVSGSSGTCAASGGLEVTGGGQLQIANNGVTVARLSAGAPVWAANSNLTVSGGAKLPAAWQSSVPEFGEFTVELKKRFKRELTLQERNDWDTALTQAREKVAIYTHSITQAEKDIDAIVYQLFQLSPDEITLIETMHR